MANETRSAIYRGFTFLLEIDGIVRAGFRECSGLDTSQDPIDYRMGVEPATARTLPGQAKPSAISLKHGITGDAELWEWRHNATRDQVDRRNGSIVLVDAHGKHQARWNFRSGWPGSQPRCVL